MAKHTKQDNPELDMHDLCQRLARKLGAGWSYSNCRNVDGTHTGTYTIDWMPVVSERRFTVLHEAGVMMPGVTIQLHAAVSGDISVSYFEWSDYPGPGAGFTVKRSISLARLCTKTKAFVLDCIALDMLRPVANERTE